MSSQYQNYGRGNSAGVLTLNPVITLDEQARGEFVVKVYQHLLLAVLAFAGMEAILLNTPIAEAMFNFFARSGIAWLLLLGLFMVGQWLVANAAADLLNPSRQYGALFGSAALYSLLFAPLLHYFFRIEQDGATSVAAAGLITAIAFAGLTVVGFVTRKDLSFMRPMIMYGFIAAAALIVAALLFGFSLGVWFSVAMIALAGGAIIYQTQSIIRKYPVNAHVAGAVALFASVMTMFWYILRLVGQLRN